MGENSTLSITSDFSGYDSAMKKVRILDKMLARTEKKAKLFNKTLKSMPAERITKVCAPLERINDLLGISMKKSRILETSLDVAEEIAGNTSDFKINKFKGAFSRKNDLNEDVGKAALSSLSFPEIFGFLKMKQASGAREERSKLQTFLSKLDTILEGFTENFAEKLKGSIAKFEKVVDNTFKKIDPYIVSLETAFADLSEKIEALAKGGGSSNSNDGLDRFLQGISLTATLMGVGVTAWPAVTAGALVVASPLIFKGMDKLISYIGEKISKFIDGFEPLDLNYFADNTNYQPSMFRGVEYGLKRNNLLENMPGEEVIPSAMYRNIEYYKDVGNSLQKSFDVSNKLKQSSDMELSYFVNKDSYQPPMFRGVEEVLKKNKLIADTPEKKIISSDIFGGTKYYQDFARRLRNNLDAYYQDKLSVRLPVAMDLYNSENKQFDLNQVSGAKANTEVNVYMDGAVKAQVEVKNEADIDKLAQQTSRIVALQLRNVIANTA